MKRIEFIGGPGIGKSTVLKEIIRMRRPWDSWITAEESIIMLSKKVAVDKSIVRMLMQICIKCSFLKRLHYRFASSLLGCYHKDVIDKMHEKYSDVAEIFLQALNLNDRISSIQKMELIKFYHRLLVEKLMLFDYFNVSNLIIYDEGIIHNNSAFVNKEISLKVIRRHVNGETGLVPVGVIYCFMDGEKYIERRRERILRGGGIMLDRTLDVYELEKLCYRSLKIAEEKVNVLISHNIPVLEIDMENSIIHNAEKVCRFICAFQ